MCLKMLQSEDTFWEFKPVFNEYILLIAERKKNNPSIEK